MNKKLKYILLKFLLLIFCIFISCNEDIPVNTSDYSVFAPGEAGINRAINVFDTVYLNGSNGNTSNDVEYIWSFALKPSGSKATLSDTSISDPTFYADKIGWYALELVLKEEEKFSEPDYILIKAKFQKSSHYFPNTVGNEWHYEVKSLTRNIIDTLKIEIVGSTIMPDGKPANIWAYDSEISYFYVDKLYVTGQDDTVRFYWWPSQQPFIMYSYIIPFTVGNELGSSLVINNDSVSIGLGTFDSGYQIVGWSYLANHDAWIVPNVGLVKQYLIERGFLGPFAEETWELIYYNLVE